MARGKLFKPAYMTLSMFVEGELALSVTIDKAAPITARNVEASVKVPIKFNRNALALTLVEVARSLVQVHGRAYFSLEESAGKILAEHLKTVDEAWAIPDSDDLDAPF